MNVLYALAAAVLLSILLALSWAADHQRQKVEITQLQADLVQADDDVSAVVAANVAADQVIATLEAANRAFEEQFALDQKAAGEAAARAAALTASLQAQSAENAVLRRKLAQENPDVAAHLRTGVPCALARQLWPQADYCSSDRR